MCNPQPASLGVPGSRKQSVTPVDGLQAKHPCTSRHDDRGVQFFSELLQLITRIGVDDRRPCKQDRFLCVSEGFPADWRSAELGGTAACRSTRGGMETSPSPVTTSIGNSSTTGPGTARPHGAERILDNLGDVLYRLCDSTILCDRFKETHLVQAVKHSCSDRVRKIRSRSVR